MLRSHTSELVCAVDPKGVITYASPSYERILGYKPSELLGQSGLTFIHPDDRAFVVAAWETQCTQNDRDPYVDKAQSVEYRMREKSGSYHFLLTSIYPVDDQVVWISRDVTGEKRLHQYREEMIRAEHLASLGTLSAMLAHELNQPLTVIRLAIENIQAQYERYASLDKIPSSGQDPRMLLDSHHEALSDCIHGVEMMTDIISRFRTFARRSGDQPVQAVNLGKVAEDTVMLVQHSAKRVRLGLSLNGMDTLRPVVANTGDMHQLFYALIENSIQAAKGKQGCRLSIQGKVVDSTVEVRFSDTCGGVAPDNLDDIFRPFYTTKPQGEGTGLGLCTVSRIVEKTGGSLHVDNQAGYGLTFRICLPVKQD